VEKGQKERARDGKGKNRRNEEKIAERKRRRNGKEGAPFPAWIASQDAT